MKSRISYLVFLSKNHDSCNFVRLVIAQLVSLNDLVFLPIKQMIIYKYACITERVQLLLEIKLDELLQGIENTGEGIERNRGFEF